MQKIINVLVLLLIGYAVYVLIIDRQRVITMDELQASDIELQGHKQVIDEEYRRLNLRFEGRGKHIQRMQRDIERLRTQMRTKVDSLGNQLEETNYYLRQTEEMLREDIRELESELRTLTDDLATYKRRTNRTILDIQEVISRIEDDIAAINEKIEPAREERGRD